MLILFNALGHGRIPRLRQKVLESRSLSRQRTSYVVTSARAARPRPGKEKKDIYNNLTHFSYYI